MATSGAFTARDHPQSRAERLNALKSHVDDLLVQTVQVGFEGKPLAAQRLLRFRTSVDMTLLSFIAEFDAEATSYEPFMIFAEGVLIAELMPIDLNAVGSIIKPVLPAGSLIELEAPAIQDATLSGGLLSLRLQRS